MDISKEWVEEVTKDCDGYYGDKIRHLPGLQFDLDILDKYKPNLDIFQKEVIEYFKGHVPPCGKWNSGRLLKSLYYDDCPKQCISCEYCGKGVIRPNGFAPYVSFKCYLKSKRGREIHYNECLAKKTSPILEGGTKA